MHKVKHTRPAYFDYDLIVLGTGAGDAVAQFSFVTHFETAQRGVLELRGLVFFVGFMALCVALNTLFVSHKRSGAG